MMWLQLLRLSAIGWSGDDVAINFRFAQYEEDAE